MQDLIDGNSLESLQNQFSPFWLTSYTIARFQLLFVISSYLIVLYSKFVFRSSHSTMSFPARASLFSLMLQHFLSVCLVPHLDDFLGPSSGSFLIFLFSSFKEVLLFNSSLLHCSFVIFPLSSFTFVLALLFSPAKVFMHYFM